MINRWLKILSIVCLLTAQIFFATHIHSPDEVISDQECVYCQTAAELAGADTPEVIAVAEPVYYLTTGIISLSENVIYFNLSYHYDTRAPPRA